MNIENMEEMMMFMFVADLLFRTCREEEEE